MTPQSQYLIEIARSVAAHYEPLETVRATMVTGSAAKGLSDFLSDIDMTIYHESMPDEAALQQVHDQIGISERKWTLGNLEAGWFAEAFDLNGIEVQIGHTTIERWEDTMAGVLKRHELDSPAQKALEGTLNCIPFYGSEIIDAWKATLANYPSDLGDAMLKKHLQFFPLWGLTKHLKSRDATIWYYQIMVEAAQNLVGTLAGLNHVYFATFQFKRMGYLLDKMVIKPANVCQRIENLFINDPATASADLESLVSETIALINQHKPHIDTVAAARRLGWRDEPWQYVS